eukprot:m.109927 g.109927  ORF g.109927 m.109927 type:complete len:302 (-) comp9055_c0_seq4:124-1029(-)
MLSLHPFRAFDVQACACVLSLYLEMNGILNAYFSESSLGGNKFCGECYIPDMIDGSRARAFFARLLTSSKTLEELQLHATFLGPKGVQTIIDHLPHCRTLVSVIVSHNSDISTEQLATLDQLLDQNIAYQRTLIPWSAAQHASRFAALAPSIEALLLGMQRLAGSGCPALDPLLVEQMLGLLTLHDVAVATSKSSENLAENRSANDDDGDQDKSGGSDGDSYGDEESDGSQDETGGSDHDSNGDEGDDDDEDAGDPKMDAGGDDAIGNADGVDPDEDNLGSDSTAERGNPQKRKRQPPGDA